MLRVILVATCLVFLVSPGFRSNSQDQVPELTPAQKEKVPALISTSIAIRRVAEILSAERIGIEAGQLFSRNGMKKLRPQLSTFPEMQLSRAQSEPLRGVIMADRLTLAEKLEIAGDTVIIANHIVFSGRAPLIKGPHDFHLFPLESFKSEYGRETVITIDTSNINGVNGVNGLNGTRGENGTNGADGNAGWCPTKKNGEDGKPGTDGMPGTNGGAGTDGTSGKDAGHQTVPISNVDTGIFYLIASGGHGGNGGHGGHGGYGGQGGNGGRGGNGANCDCDAGGNGYGGKGGAAGAGGVAGNGGKGGDGGSGGNAGKVVVTHPFAYATTTMKFRTSGGHAGYGGHGGHGGLPGMEGAAGHGGRSFKVLACDRGHDGTSGLSVEHSRVRGIAGDRGTPGLRGSHTGSYTSDITGISKRGVASPAGFEPGATSKDCTEWFWVTFDWQGSQYHETGRTLIGCY